MACNLVCEHAVSMLETITALQRKGKATNINLTLSVLSYVEKT